MEGLAGRERGRWFHPRHAVPTLRAADVLRAFVLAALLACAAAASAQDLSDLVGGGEAEEAPARTIATRQTPAEDRALEKRLLEIYAQVEGLGGVAVEVTAGVVRLSGEVLSSSAREKALQIADQLQGVVEVQAEITESRDLDRRLVPVLDDLRERTGELLANLPLFGVALVVFLAIALAGRLLTAWEAPFRRLSRNGFTRDLLRQAIRALFFVAAAVIALQVLDATALVAAVAGLAGLIGLALSFAFRDLAENYFASLLLSLRQPFLANEHVVIDGHEGHVVRLNSRATILINPDGNHVRIPNAQVFKATILNYTRNPQRRFTFAVGVGPESNLGEALGLGLDTLARMPGVLDEPAPQAWVENLGDWNVALTFLGWIDQREADYAKARGEAMRLVKERFDAAGIAMPEPTVNVRAPGAAPERKVAPPPPLELEVDIKPESQIEEAVADDRAAAGLDLLDDAGRVE